jgi:DNA ligase-1
MNKIYTKLYSLDSKGKIRTWLQEQEGCKYRTISGLEDGKKVTSEWTIVEGKNIGKANETSPTEQATAEIEAEYKKKLKTNYTQTLKNVDSATKYIEPILAKSYKDYIDEVNFDNGEFGMQVKFNGVCCLESKPGAFSRKGEKFLSVPHIEEALVPFFEKYPDAVLHGELFNDDLREKLNEIVKLCRKSVNITNEDYKSSRELIKYYIYDGYCESAGVGENAPYEKRKAWIDKNVIGKYDYCVEVKTIIIKDKAHLDKFFGERVERGDEGVILRRMNMKYVHKRDKNLLKYKPLNSEEMTIIDIKEGNGNWAGKAKIITLKTKDGKVFDGTFKGNMLDAEVCLKNKNHWIGQLVTIQFNGYTGLGCPQYSQFDYNNCLRAD